MSATKASRNGLPAAALLAGTVCALAIPSAVLAFSSGFGGDGSGLAERADIESINPGEVDARLAREVSVRALARGHVFRFTPAGTTTRPDRSVTVAVRVDQETAHTIAVRKLATAPTAVLGTTTLRIAPSGYSLGLARGYHGFAQGITTPGDIRDIDMPDLAALKPTSPAGGNSRFSPRIALDEGENPGRAPRTFAGDGEQSVDVGGSYRITRNLDVTAGVRYQQERERLAPLTDDGKQDSQAVYVGTQFRF